MLNRSVQSRPRRSTILLVDDDPFLAFSRKFALERSFHDVERVSDAAEALIRLEELADRLALVIAALDQPGLAGPQFVEELSRRKPGIPILVIGRMGEIALDYRGEQVQFLPRHASAEDLLAGACEILVVPRAA